MTSSRVKAGVSQHRFWMQQHYPSLPSKQGCFGWAGQVDFLEILLFFRDFPGPTKLARHCCLSLRFAN
jgi:hypothetical protein